MAVLPTVTAYRQAPRPTRGLASISPGAASAVADAVGDAGRAAQQIGLDILDREATAAAKEADTRASEEYRKALYDPETGFTNQRGGVAVGQYGAINSRIDAIAARSLEGLSGRARRKAKDSIDARAERAKQTVDTHTSGERSSWIDGASQARIGAAYQDALLNPAETAASLAVAEGELRGQAARSGWSAEKLAGEIAANRSKLYADQASVIGETDPVKAMDYIRANRDAMLPTDIANVERTIGRQERQVVGAQLGSSVYDRRGVSAEAQAAMASLETATGEVFNVISALRDTAHNAAVGGAKGSQHLHGNAFDVDVKGKTEAEKIALIHAARTAGFGGIGIYGGSLHFDVGPTRAWGADYSSGSVPEWARGAVGAERGAVDMNVDPASGIAAIKDPVMADAAMTAYRERGSADAGRRKAVDAGIAEDAAYTAANGSPPPDSAYDPGVVDRIYPPAEAEAVKRGYDQAIADAQVMHGVKTATNEQLAEQVAAAVKAVSEPGHTVEDVNRLDTLNTAIDQRNKAIVEDPAGYAQQSFREVGAAFKGYADAAPENKAATASAYVAATDFNYDRLQVPNDMRAVLPKQTAGFFARQFNEMPPDIAAQSLIQFTNDWGAAAPRVMRDLSAAGLAPEYVVATRIADDPGLMAEVMSLRGQTVEDLKKGVTATKVTDASIALTDGIDDYVAVFEAGDDTGEATRTINDTIAVAERLTLQRIRQGVDPTVAAVDVAAKLFPGKVMNVSNAKLILPKGVDESTTARLLDRGMSEDQIRAFNPAPMDDPNLPEFADKEVMIAAAQNGMWLTNSEGDGAVLHLNVGGYYIPVMDGYGRQYQVLFGAATPGDKASARIRNGSNLAYLDQFRGAQP